MTDWYIGLNPARTRGTPTIIGPLTALIAWKRLTSAAREAIEAAYPDRPIRSHSRTRDALTRHGFAVWDNQAQDWLLTPAGREVFRWVDKPWP